MVSTLIKIWGLGGVIALLLNAVVRVSPLLWEALRMPLAWHHIAFGVVWTGFMAYAEGYRGFQLRFSPRVVARAWHLAAHPRPLHVLLGPAFCIGYLHANRRRLITSWLLTAMIVAIVVGVRALPQPWRGLIDGGVVVGLSWGMLSVLWLAMRAVREGGTDVDPQLPTPAPHG